MVISLDALPGQVLAFLWPLFRVAAMLMVAPVLGSRAIPVRVRVGVSVLLTMVLYPTLAGHLPHQPAAALGLLITAQEIVLGLATGFLVRLALSAFEVAGTVVATQMGLGFAALTDPQNGGQIPVLSQYFAVIVTLLFLALDGHLLLIKVLVLSFQVVPVGELRFNGDGIWQLLEWGRHIFSGAVLVALPAIASLTVVNLAFGVMTRVAPQMNLFAVGFPITLLLGLLVVLFGLPSLLPHLERLLASALETMGSMLTVWGE
jgi:flagellar biosynthetic protein FliR